ncbi:MAG: rhamnulokinase [Parasporobacterium sp.]|nr:rhamnulokinase [Parasporobacterium sp.]
MFMKYLAVDIGASSGRHIAGWMENGVLQTKEIFRFPNGVKELDGHLTWDMEALEGYVRTGIDLAQEMYDDIACFSIDTWGVDYVLLKGDEPVWPCFAYRDGRTEEAVKAVHEKFSFEKLYVHTGIQFQPFNTIYQLYTDNEAGRLQGVTDFLMVPEYLTWKLTGVKGKEYTNATTTGLVNAASCEYDREIVEALGLPADLFGTLLKPGAAAGEYNGIKAVLCASHDTASAVEGIAMDKEGLFLSSGTWSLLGAKLPEPVTSAESLKANFTNEGGVGYIRYLKNIMGMWIVNELRRELCHERSFDDIVKEAEESTFDLTVNADDQAFLAPRSMKQAFDEALGTELKEGDYFRCAYRSLAISYAKAIKELEQVTGKTYDRLYIVGGGAKNKFLNRLTEETTGKTVIALPIEATAIGNLKIQMEVQ